MEIEKMYEVTKCFREIEKILKRETTFIFNSGFESENILAVLAFDEKEVSAEDRLVIVAKIRGLKKLFKINHTILNERIVLFQGALKGENL